MEQIDHLEHFDHHKCPFKGYTSKYCLALLQQEIAAQLLSILPKYRKIDGTEYYQYMSQYFEFNISFKLKTKNSVKNNLFEHIIIV